MCGIWAMIGYYNLPKSRIISSSMKIAHRGPDAYQMCSVNEIPHSLLAFHRLAIIDTSSGMQPMVIRALPHLILCCNGEIYNYRQNQETFNFNYETKSDCESILHLYNHGGIEFAAKHLNGVFSFILLDVSKGKVFLARDTYGVRPLFTIYLKGEFLAVSSEAKGVADLNHDKTKKIEPFKPGQYEEYTLDVCGRPTLSKRVQFYGVGEAPEYKTMITSYEKDVLGMIRRFLTEAVRVRMMSARRIGCLLSGGLDSSLVAALVLQHAKQANFDYPTQTFSIGMKGSPDIKAARQVAAHIGSEHHEVEFTSNEGISALCKVIHCLEIYDVVTVRGSVAMYLLTQYISNQTDSTVIMSGEGSDELAQGYLYFHKAPNPEKADRDSRRLLRDLYLFDNLRADRTSAAHGLEVRVPFLDHQFTSYYLSLPAATRVPQDGVEKYLIRKAFDGTGMLPDEILWRQKEGFSDGVSSVERSWFSVLLEYAENQISDDQMKQSTERFPFNTPQTKEAYLYRQIFEEAFPGQGHLTPYLWCPQWVGITDPSARMLDYYKV